MSDPAVTGESTRDRLTFATQRTLAYVSVLELGTVWERSLRRAGIPLKYSQGFNPRPRMQFAAPLPVGCGSEADLLDIWLEESWPSEAIAAALEGATPQDLTVVGVAAVPEAEPGLAECLVATEYRIWLRDVQPDVVESAVTAFLASDAAPMDKRGRRHRGKTYDLRALVTALRLDAAPAPWIGLWMHLRARPGATGRPDEVLKALNLADAPRRCTRVRLSLSNDLKGGIPDDAKCSS